MTPFELYWDRLKERNPGLHEESTMTLAVLTFKAALQRAFTEGEQNGIGQERAQEILTKILDADHRKTAK